MNPALPLSPMTASDPIFWMGCSLLLVAISLTAIAVVAVPVMQEMVQVSRSAGRLLDTLDRELPRTLEALRATGADLSNLQKDVNRGVQRAANVVEQVDRGLVTTKQQVSQVQTTARGFVVGFKAAWRTFRSPQDAALPVPDRAAELTAGQTAPVHSPTAAASQQKGTETIE